MKKEEQLMKSIIIKYSKYILTLLAVAAMAVGLLMPAQIKAADSYNKDKKGSITINFMLPFLSLL